MSDLSYKWEGVRFDMVVKSVNGIQLDLFGDQWRGLTNVITKIWVPLSTADYLTSWVVISVSGRTER